MVSVLGVADIFSSPCSLTNGYGCPVPQFPQGRATLPGGGQSPHPSVFHTHHLSVPASCSGSQQPSKDEGPPATALKDPTEPRVWARVCDVNAVVLMCVNIFCYAYFA